MFLGDALIFILLVLGTILIYLYINLGPFKRWKKYFSTKDGKGILYGIVVAPAAIFIIGLILYLFPFNSARGGSFFNESGVFLGLDWTKRQSPMCEANSTDEKGTSNLGAFANVWRSDSNAVEFNLKYTHHSCALGSDDKNYDAAGVELRWIPWRRNQ